jgi:hypothetical protein
MTYPLPLSLEANYIYTLEEVWKEKTASLAQNAMISAFTFDYGGKEYMTSRINFLGVGQWSTPKEKIKL